MSSKSTTPGDSLRRPSAVRILVADDEPSARDGLALVLAQEGYEVVGATDGVMARELLSESAIDVVVTDRRMQRMDGLELLARLREEHPAVPVIVVTAFGDVASAVEAMRAGASDYLAKPVDVDALLVAIRRALDWRAIRIENDTLRSHVERETDGAAPGLVGLSEPMQAVYRVARQVAPARATVLITGESGTGKGELARAIHSLGPRRDKPFVTLQCAAVPEALLESELFGHEKGSFTGADRRRIGRFESAAGGTLFLDEIGELTPATQVKLLRVLQERAFERVGGDETLSTDARLVAATNRDLSAAVRAGTFREDLFYRLNVVRIEMPPLRTRGNDVLLLAQHFLRTYNRENGKQIHGFSADAWLGLLGHPWPGNVRELENAIERAVVMCGSDVIEGSDLPSEVAITNPGEIRIPGSSLPEIEKHAILATLAASEWSTARAAELLGVSVRTIQYRLGEYGIDVREKRGGTPG